MSTVVTCPQCRQNLQVPPEMLGKEVRCPACQRIFTANGDGARPPVPPPLAPDDVPEWDYAQPLEDEDTDMPREEKPRKRKKSRSKGSSGGGYYDELARRQRKLQTPGFTMFGERVDGGIAILFFGIASLIPCLGIVFCGLAWTWGTNDLNEMNSRRWDDEGKSLTKIGLILGLVGAGVQVVTILLTCVCGFMGGLPGGRR